MIEYIIILLFWFLIGCIFIGLGFLFEYATTKSKRLEKLLEKIYYKMIEK